MKRSLAFSRQSILALLVLLSFSSCVQSYLVTKLSSHFEDNSEIHYADPDLIFNSSSVPQWPLASSEVLELADGKGELSYYIPIKVILGQKNPVISVYLRMFTLRDGADIVWVEGGDENKKLRKEVVLYIPLLEPLIDVLPTDIAQLLSEQKIDPEKDPTAFLENELPDDYRLVRRMKVPDLRARLDKIDYIPYTMSFTSPRRESSWGNRLAFLSVVFLVDIPLTLAGSCTAIAYDNTIGFPIIIYRKYSSQSPHES